MASSDKNEGVSYHMAISTNKKEFPTRCPDVIVLSSSTRVGEIDSVYPGFTIMIAIGLQNPYAKPKSFANLVLYDVY
jgi:hypothetical protein